MDANSVGEDKAVGCGTNGANDARPYVGGLYRHFRRGHIFRVLAIGRWDDAGIDMVVHVGLHDGSVWARPMSNFTGENDGRKRFVHVGMSSK